MGFDYSEMDRARERAAVRDAVDRAIATSGIVEPKPPQAAAPAPVATEAPKRMTDVIRAAQPERKD